MDSSLIEQSQAGDPLAFGMLFEQYKNLVYKTAVLMLDSHQEAEDVQQEVFVQVHRHLKRYDATVPTPPAPPLVPTPTRGYAPGLFVAPATMHRHTPLSTCRLKVLAFVVLFLFPIQRSSYAHSTPHT
jgi:hypothetical protein